MKTIALLVLISIPFAACANNKKAEVKTPLGYANGENYTHDTTINGVPLLKTKDRWTTISGKVVFTNPTFDPSTGIQNVQLLQKGKIVAQTRTTADGAFQLKGPFDNGDYQLQVNSKTLKGTTPLTVKDYEVRDVILPATLSAP